MHPKNVATLVVLAVFFSGSVGFILGEANWRPKGPRFQTSSFSVITPMLRLAGVRAGERVADLGCGDGRIVITAARDFQATGLCVERDLELLMDARANARLAGVEDRIQFVHADVMASDLSAVDVVTLFLNRELNDQLRPKLQRELSRSARVVSLIHDIGDWPDAEVSQILADGRSYTVRKWTVQ